MDELDVEIVKILCKDARISFRKIGKTLGIATDTVFSRYKKLKQEGKIKGSIVVLSSKAIGIKGWCGFLVRVKEGYSPLIIKDKLKHLPQLYSLAQLSGDHDFYLEIGFREFEEVDIFVTRLTEIEEITTIDPIFYATHDWPLPTLSTLQPEILNWLLKLDK